MRKNVERTLRAWAERTPTRPASVWTDGESIYSYQTVIATRYNDGVLLNVTKYSPTTTNHQSGVRLGTRDFEQIEVDGLPRGATAETLRRQRSKDIVDSVKDREPDFVLTICDTFNANLVR